MNEKTIITTLKITMIYKDIPKKSKTSKIEYGDNIKNIVKKALNADDVIVTNVQEFVLDEKED